MKLFSRLFSNKITITEALAFAYWCMQSGKCTQSCTQKDYNVYLKDKERWQNSIAAQMNNRIKNHHFDS